MLPGRHVVEREDSRARRIRTQLRTHESIEHPVCRRVNPGSSAPGAVCQEFKRDGRCRVVAVDNDVRQGGAVYGGAGSVGRIVPIRLELHAHDIFGQHVSGSAIGASTTETDRDALRRGRNEQGGADHLACLAPDDRQRVEIRIPRRRHGRRAVAQLVGSRDRDVISQPLNRPRTIHFGEERRRDSG